MTDDEHSTTGLLKRKAPFWHWVRGNPSLVISGLSILITGAITWHDLKSRMGSVETAIAALSDKVDEYSNRPTTVSAEQFAELRSEVDRQKGRWEQVDSVPKGHRR
jgi:hypothetical protein